MLPVYTSFSNDGRFLRKEARLKRRFSSRFSSFSITLNLHQHAWTTGYQELSLRPQA